MEPVRNEKAFHLRIFTRDLNIRKSIISCCEECNKFVWQAKHDKSRLSLKSPIEFQ